MDDSLGFKSMQDQVLAALVTTTRTTGQISAEDLGFQKSLNPEVGDALKEQSERLLGLASALLRSAASISELRSPILEDTDDVESNWRSVVDVVDSLLEKSDICLDEYTGVIKRKEPGKAEQYAQSFSASKKPTSYLGNAFRTQNLVKPQLAFDIKPNNKDNKPWKPILMTKPHAKVPLEESLGIITNRDDQQQYDYTSSLPPLLLLESPTPPEGLSKSQRSKLNRRMNRMKRTENTISNQIVDDTDNSFRYRHPYEREILELKYPDQVYQNADPIPYQPVETTSAIFVDTENGVLEMLEELKNVSELAVDLEHHDTRSFVGVVSLMQISTREKDWIVDTLKPWRRNLQVLNEVFADPNILKVFHGAYMDIEWLQRDLGLYVVGLFDTHHASRALGYAGGSLAFLLKKFIDFDADKKYQLADWRIRPIPEEMYFYARSDTHYLLYIYDNMRNELIDRGNPDVPDQDLIERTLQKSKDVSLIRHERQIYNSESGQGPGGWYGMLLKTPSLFSNEQFAVFRAVHEWRDKTARADDDSPTFVMSQQSLLSVAKLMPMDMVALLRTLHPASHGVKSRAGELLDIIKVAKARGRTGPTMMDIVRPETVGAVAKRNLPTATVKTLVAVTDEGDLRSDSSAFWGGAFGSSIWDAPTAAKNQDLRLAVPLPELSSEIFATSNGVVHVPAIEDCEISLTIALPREPKKEDEAFVLRRGSKRKAEANSESDFDASADNEIALPDSEEDEARQKAARKAARKAEKKAAKAARKATEAEADQNAFEEEDEKVFDYTKADSVLHGKPNDGNNDKGGKKKKKKQPFDPYQKSADASKGMRRAQTERAGRSHTFKS